jgi:D-glycero-D-manno-heptose 1,7-bisphosphate phosphatase
VVVTNQSGIARGLFDWNAFESVHREMIRQLSLSGAVPDATIACPYHPEFTDNYAAVGEMWRKPAPGMITLAAQRLNIDTRRSFMVGDTIADIGAAKAARLAGAVLVQTGHGAVHMEEAGALESPEFSFAIATDSFDALTHLRDLGLSI